MSFCSSSRQRIIPLRGPHRVLWIVVVTTSAWGTGLGCSPAATRPAKWAMSTISRAPTESAISRKAGKSSCRGYADQPATITFGLCSWARRSTSSMSTRRSSRRTWYALDVVQLARHVQLHPVGQVAAVVQGQAKDRVARLEHRHVGGVVGLRAGVGLDVRMLGPEELQRPVDRQLLGHVDLLAAAVIAAAGIALGVLVGEHGARRLQHGLGHEVLRGDHLQRRLLAVELTVQHTRYVGVHLRQWRGLKVVGQVGQLISPG